MNAREFIKERYPSATKDFENGICKGFTDIAYMCENYYEYKINVSHLSGGNSQDEVDHPKHYNSYPIEVIDMMLLIWGREKTIDFCIMNAFKYRMRAGHKDKIEQDLEKEKWYLNKANELK